MHYYGETDKYDYANNKFGFDKGDLSHVKSVTSAPVGSGPYTFESYSNGAVTLQKNANYWKGEPKIDTVIWREMQDVDKIPGVVSGTIDVTALGGIVMNTHTHVGVHGPTGGPV